MKKLLCFLLAACLAAGPLLACAAEGSPWANPELPGGLPDGRPGPEEDLYLWVNYDRHRQASRTDAAGDDSAQARAQRDMDDAVWALVESGESTEARVLRILASLLMDGERREREGMEPLAACVRHVRDTRDLAGFSALCREEDFLFGSPYAVLRADRSEQDPERFALHLQTAQVLPQAEQPEDATI